MAIIIFMIFWIGYYIFRTVRHEKHKISSIITIIIIALLFSLNCKNADSSMYESIYNHCLSEEIIDHGNDFLYIIINRLFYLIGFDYQSFHCLLICSCLLIVYSYIFKHTQNTTPVMIIYAVTAGLFDYIQQRQFLATCIILLGIDNLKSKGAKNIIKYVIYVAVASLVHKGSITYLLFVPFMFQDSFKKKRSVQIGVFVGLIVFVLSTSDVPYKLLRSISGEGVASFYFISNNFNDSVKGILYGIIFQQLFLFGLLLLSTKTQNKSKEDERSYSSCVLLENAILIGCSPLNFLSTQFKRLYRVIVIPSYCVLFDNISFTNKKIEKKEFIMILYIICYSIIYYRISLRANPNIVSDIFNNNYLFAMLIS